MLEVSKTVPPGVTLFWSTVLAIPNRNALSFLNHPYFFPTIGLGLASVKFFGIGSLTMALANLDLTFNTPRTLQVYHMDNKAIFENHGTGQFPWDLPYSSDSLING